MITVDEAKALVESRIKKLNPTQVELLESLNGVLAEDIYAPLDLPSFHQSAMDGYVIRSERDLNEGENLLVAGEIKAGDVEMPRIQSGESYRIFTGAMVPEKGNTIVIQEHVERNENHIKLIRDVKLDANIRKQGEQIKKGDLALSQGTRITSAALSFMASLGLTHVLIYRKPTVGIVLTGNELVKPGEHLPKGRIYESNSIALKSAVENAGYQVISLTTIRDTYQETFDELKGVLQKVDLLLVSGGISVGDYDFVGRALREAGIEEVFYKVKQKPGKPLFFGQLEDKFVFALPGNPASALVCFYQYGLPSLRVLSGGPFIGLRTAKANLISPFIKKGERAVFLKAKVDEQGAEILEGQLSHMMHTFAISNALVYLPWDQSEFKKGDEVLVYFLPD